MKDRTGALVVVLLLVTCQLISAGDATWGASPANRKWDGSANWTPATVPNGPDDTATFEVSTATKILVEANTEVSEMIFDSGASPFEIKLRGPNIVFTISGAGITNLSGTRQRLSTAHEIIGPEWHFTNSATADNVFIFNDVDGKTSFYDNATAASASITNHGGFSYSGAQGGITQFFDNTTAGTATFVNLGSVTSDAPARVYFLGNSSADHATFFNYANYGQTIFGDDSTAAYGIFHNIGGETTFALNATAANGTFINSDHGQIYFYGGTAANGRFTNEVTGVTDFYYGTGGDATFVTKGATTNDGYPGFTVFEVESTAGNCTVIAEGGANGGPGGSIYFSHAADGGTARLEFSGNASLDISIHYLPGTTTGSIEGEGLILLGGNNLGIGANNRNTTFAGVIRDGGAYGGTGGSLTKVGTGTLTLSNGGSIYTGGTAINEGELRVENRAGSATGNGPVQIDAGTLSGPGRISGAVTVGTGTGAGAFLAPSTGRTKPATLTIRSPITFKADATYSYQISTTTAQGDTVVADGATIENGAQFSLVPTGQGTLTVGTVFTALDNTSATPIAGTFTNLPDGGTITIGNNTFQADYQGGDGNDFTLTVIP